MGEIDLGRSGCDCPVFTGIFHSVPYFNELLFESLLGATAPANVLQFPLPTQ